MSAEAILFNKGHTQTSIRDTMFGEKDTEQYSHEKEQRAFEALKAAEERKDAILARMTELEKGSSESGVSPTIGELAEELDESMRSSREALDDWMALMKRD